MTGYFEAPGALTYGLGRVAGALQAFNPQPVTIVFCNMDNLPLMKVSFSADTLHHAVLCCGIATQTMVCSDLLCCVTVREMLQCVSQPASLIAYKRRQTSKLEVIKTV